jgi:hypothetical protein
MLEVWVVRLERAFNLLVNKQRLVVVDPFLLPLCDLLNALVDYLS